MLQALPIQFSANVQYMAIPQPGIILQTPDQPCRFQTQGKIVTADGGRVAHRAHGLIEKVVFGDGKGKYSHTV